MLFLRADNLVAFCLAAALAVLAIAVLAMRADGRLLHQRQATAEAARRQWSRALLDASFDGLLIHRQGLILQMNRALVRMLGTREREWLGQHFANLARPDQAAAMRVELEAPQPQLAEFCLLRTNKTELKVEISSHNAEFEGQPATVTAIRDISQRLADAQRITRLTHYDPLTGLANRKRFGEMLASAITQHDRQSGAITVFTIDLDAFKSMNEQLGRLGGDLLLKQAAARIGALAAREDTLARLGGDKFALLMIGNGKANRGLSLGGQLSAAFNEPFIIDGQLVKLSLSIGIAVYPDHAGDPEGLMKASAFALAQAEQAGGGVAHMYSHSEAGAAARQPLKHEELRPVRNDAQRLASDLRQAIFRQEMKLVYQPIFRNADLAPAGFEALARWYHPAEGLIGPERFLPIADAAGLTHEIGLYLLEQACAEAVAAGGIKIALNIASVQLRDINLATRITGILQKTGLPPALLEIEIAENLLIENRMAAAQALTALAATGIGLALDDFGTGYSSLNSLGGLPFTRLKIDRRFTAKLGQDSTADAIVHAILNLATNLHLEVTAVGIERPEQLDFLRRHGCHCVQGPLLGPPGTRALAHPPSLTPQNPPRLAPIPTRLAAQA